MRALATLTLLLAACATTTERTETRETMDSPTAVVTRLYDLVTFGPGTTPDWDEVRALFVEEAVVVLRMGPDEMAVFSLDGFVNDFVQFIEQAGVEETGFTERILELEERAYGNIANVLVRFDSHITGSKRPPREGIDSFELIRRDGAWRIVSIVNERPTRDNPIPADLFR